MKLDIEPDLPWVALDEAQIRQVIINLIKNAREAMPSGGVINVHLLRDAGGVALRIIDHGEGMTPEQRERIFDLFYTTKEKGSGVGLPTCRRLVEGWGGELQLQSKAGDTRFTFGVPRA